MVTPSGQRLELGVVALRGFGADRDQLLGLAGFAESAGLHSIWINEHIIVPEKIESRYPYSPDGRPHMTVTTAYAEAMSTLGFLASATMRVRLGTAVTPLITRHPLFLAKQAATVDRLSGGRLELGVGAGWMGEEAEALDLPHDHRGRRLAESIDILRRAWTAERFDFEGSSYRFQPVGVAPRPVQGGNVPIWVGGTGPQALAASARCSGNLMWRPSVADASSMVAELRSLSDQTRVAAAIPLDDSTDYLVARMAEIGVSRLLFVIPEWTAEMKARVSRQLERRRASHDK